MLDNLFEYFTNYDINLKESKILIACSGGKDSISLTHALHKYCPSIVVAHFNHQLRQEANHDESFCRKFCENLDIPFVSGSSPVAEICKNKKWGIEEGARLLRYDFLQDVASRTGCDYIATAHHQDDDIETMLFHFVRGTGMQGLAGIPQKRENIIRPFIQCTRKQIINYCIENNLEYVEDSMNEDESYSRVKIRKKIIPELEKIHPGFRNSIQMTQEIISQENRFLNKYAAECMKSCLIFPNKHLSFLTNHSETFLDIQKLVHMDKVLIRRICKLCADFFDAKVTFDQMKILSENILSKNNSSITTLDGKVVFCIKDHFLHVFLQTGASEIMRTQLDIPDSIESHTLGWSLSADVVPLEHFKKSHDNLDVYIDLNKCKRPLHLRNMQEGDRFIPLGMSGSKLMTDLLNGYKLSAMCKKVLPVICDFSGPIWIPGCQIAERVKIDTNTEKCLFLKMSSK